jgi:hypothetical protein
LKSLRVLALALVATAAAACAGASAKPRTDPLPLVIPEPPPRVVEPLPEVEELPAEPVRREPASPTARAPRPARETGVGKPPEATKPEPPRPESPPPVEPAPPAAPPGAPRPELRTPETLDEAGAERQVRETLDRAARTLKGVDYRSLRREARQQYDTAKLFVTQAEEALKVRNYVAAKYLADKAETIAKGLTGR